MPNNIGAKFFHSILKQTVMTIDQSSKLCSWGGLIQKETNSNCKHRNLLECKCQGFVLRISEIDLET